MLSDILKSYRLIEAKKLSNKVSFKCFYIEELEDIDTVMDTDDLTDKSSVKVLLITDKNFDKETLGDDDEYTISVSDLVKYMQDTIPQYKKDDFIDFGGSYTFMHLVGSYIADTFGLIWFKSYDRLVQYMERQAYDNRQSTGIQNRVEAKRK